MKKIVITGGPYSGKTTIINHLSKLGFQTIHETAIELIEELNRKMGLNRQRKWRKKSTVEFETMLVKRQSEVESKIKAGKKEIVFLDRGIYDAIAYCRLKKAKVPKELLDIVKDHQYEKVFLLETLSKFKQRNKTGRISDKKNSIEIGKLIENVYREKGLEVIQVKEMSVQKRITFIKKHLKLNPT